MAVYEHRHRRMIQDNNLELGWN